jgi:hypothetical protein
MKKVSKTCWICGKRFSVRSSDSKRGKGQTCGLSCAVKLRWRLGQCHGVSGSQNPNWKGGMTKSTRGYWYVLMPNHPRAMKSGYVKRADLVLEKKIGRPLRNGEIAHHIDENKENDSSRNLELKLLLDHTRQHIHERAEKARKLNPPKPKQPGHPVNRRYSWPSDKILLRMRLDMSLRQIAKKIGCSHKSVDRRIKRISGVHWSER